MSATTSSPNPLPLLDAVAQAATPARVGRMFLDGLAVMSAPASIQLAATLLSDPATTAPGIVSGVVGIGVCAMITVRKLGQFLDDGTLALAQSDSEDGVAPRAPQSGVGQFVGALQAYRGIPSALKVDVSGDQEGPASTLPPSWRPPL